VEKRSKFGHRQLWRCAARLSATDPEEFAMAEIENVHLLIGGYFIASAPSADLEPPDGQLTVTDVTWVYPSSASQYLQQICAVQGTAAGLDYNGTFQITGMDGNYQTVWLTPV
jgi:hypothetical protein